MSKSRNTYRNGVSIVVCCHNSKARLPDTLEHLARQRLESLSAEVVLVDNNSSDNTAGVAIGLWAQYEEPYSLKVVSEPRPGLSSARKKGISEALFDTLIFCDDDNWLCPDYVQTAYNVISSNNEIGALGGWCEAVFEGEKPDWFDRYARYFAVSRQGKESGDITTKKGCLYGAGMVLKKEVWNELKERGFDAVLSDRKGKSLSSGGDTELTLAIRLLGYRLWFDERLYFKHFMTSGRLNLNYLSQLRNAMVYSNFICSAYIDELNDRPIMRSNIELPVKGFKDVLRRIKWLITGDYETKEQSRIFFKLVYLKFFKFREYVRTRKSIKRWLPQKS